MRRFAPVVLALLALAVPAQAQAPTPMSQVAVDLDPGPAGIPLGASHQIPFSVKLTLSNIACTAPATATVSLSVADKPSPLNGVKGTVPATVTFNVPQGSYVTPVGQVYEGTADAILSINVTAEALADHEHAFQVTGKFDGSLGGCQGAGPIPSAEGSAEHQIKTGPPAAQGTARGASQSQGQTSNGGGDSKGAPGPEIPLILLAIGLVALRGRRHG